MADEMPRMIFVNLPVTDLAASMAFYTRLGFVNEPRFTDETGAAMQWSDTIVVMLLTHAKWKTFTDRPIPGRDASEVMNCLSMRSRDEVDTMAQAAGEGGTVDVSPPQDHGFMYGRSILDPDGHVWELMWMDPAMASGEMPAAAQA